jgi:hypothetical protein
MCHPSGTVYFAYVDESGNVGWNGSWTYTLGCVMVRGVDWPGTFDRLIAFRRFLRARFGVLVRAEIKANYLIRNAPPFRNLGLGDQARADIYRQAIRLQPKLGMLTFGIVINKGNLRAKNPDRDPRDVAWEFLLQRFERFSSPVGSHPGEPVLLVHDEGEGAIVRKLARKARRAGTAGSAFGTGLLKRPARLLLDDPVPRDSRQSYFLQMADLTAYAAFRRIHPPPVRPVNIVPHRLWDQLGAAIYKPANQLAGGIPGIVAWP